MQKYTEEPNTQKYEVEQNTLENTQWNNIHRENTRRTKCIKKYAVEQLTHKKQKPQKKAI